MTDMERMAHLWNKDGLSMGQIAAQFGVTRQVVAGIIHRNRDKFESRRDANGKKPRKEREAPVTAAQKANQRRSAFHAAKGGQEYAPVISAIEAMQYDASRLLASKDLLDLRSCDCRWPLNDGAPFLFCAEEVTTGSAYCAHHKQRSTGRGTISESRAIKDARYAA
jgi:GcrA cell cycle regulator